MIKLLTQIEAGKLLASAYEGSAKNGTRLGQELICLLCKDHRGLVDSFLATDKDFFYEENHQKVIYTFFDHYVEK